jgi:O-antigen/teichoic acid export membrane protein
VSAGVSSKAAVKRATSRAGLYGVGTVLQNAIGLVMLPIYTRYLTPEDYGVIALLVLANSLFGLFFGVQLVTGIMRHYFLAADEGGRRQVISTALMASTVLRVCAALALAVLAGPVSSAIFGTEEYRWYVALFAFTLITDPLSFVPLLYLRALDRPLAFVLVSATKLFVQLALNILLVAVLKWEVLGIIVSGLVGGVLVGGTLSVWTLMKTGLVFSRTVAGALIRYSWPLVLAAAFSMYVSLGDKYFLRRFVGLEAVGLLALAARIADALNGVIAKPFQQYWGAERFRAYSASPDLRFYQVNFVLITAALCVGGTAISMFATDLLWIMAAEPFWQAAALVTPLVFAALLHQVGQFGGLGIMTSGRTTHFIGIGLTQAILATIGFIVLIPLAGAMGAALTAVAVQGVRAAWLCRTGRRYFDMELPWRRFYTMLGLSALAIFIAAMFDDQSLAGFAGRCLVFACYLPALFYSPALEGEERRTMLNLILRRLRKDPANSKA